MKELGEYNREGGKAKMRCVAVVTAVGHRIKISPNNVCLKAGDRNIYPLDHVFNQLKVKT